MTTFQIIGLIVVALLGLYVFYCIYDLEKFNKKKDRRPQSKVLAVLMTLAAIAVGQNALAQSSYKVTSTTNGNVTTFKIERSGFLNIEETVYYRTVNLTAVAGKHYTATAGSLTFPPNIDKMYVEVSETVGNATDIQYYFQTGTKRTYRFEVLDQGGFLLGSKDQDITYSNDLQYTGNYTNKIITDLVYFNNNGEIQSGTGNYIDVSNSESQNSWIKVTDGGYKQGAHAISTDNLFHGSNALRNYLDALGTRMYATVYFTQKEEGDGYQYIQITTGTGYDSGDDPNGGVNDPVNSVYKACFILSYTPSGSVMTNPHGQFFPHRYDYVNKAAEQTAGITHYEFDYDNSYLYQQKYKSNTPSYDAPNTGSLNLSPKVSTMRVLFDAGGSGGDDWDFTNLKARLALLDNTAPTVLNNYQVSGGRHSRGNTIYVSIPFSEIVVVSGSNQQTYITTTWGHLYLQSQNSSNYTNVLTFGGTISDNATGTFRVTGYNSSMTIHDLVNNTFNGTISHDFGITLDDNYEFSIAYDLDGGSVSTANPTSYNYGTASFTLNNPTKPGYTFLGWTGSNGTTPKTTVTISNHSNGNRIYNANWGIATYNITYNLGGGTVATANPTTYNINTPTFTLNNPTREYYNFTGWTGTDIAEPTMTVTVTQGSMGDREYTANWTAMPMTGSGTPTDPYIIATPTHFELLAQNVQNGNTYSDKYFKLGNDIDMSDVDGFMPIGSLSHNFSGNFDGDGKTISNLTINRPDESYVGLFGFTSNNTIQNIILDNVSVYGSTGTGCVVGGIDNSTVSHCIVKNSSVTTDSSNSGVIVGSVSSNDPASSTANYYHNCSRTYDNVTANVNIGADGADRDWVRSVHSLTLPANVTAAGESVEIGNAAYYVSNTDVTLTCNPSPGYSVTYSYDDGSIHTIGGDTFTMPAADATVSAMVSPIVYDITYNLKHGEWPVGQSNPTTYTVETPTFTLVNPIKTDDTFVGWTGTGLTEVTQTVTIAQGSIGDRGYTAHWDNDTIDCQIVDFPWTETFESYAAGEFSDPCWINERIQDGTGSGNLSVFKVSTSSMGDNSNHQLQLPDMPAGTLTKLVLPEMNVPANYEFSIDIYRSSSTYNDNYLNEGIRVYASTDGEIEGATELAFIPRHFGVSNNVIPAESETGWYTYELPIGMSGTCYIILRGESQYCTATYMDNLAVKAMPTCPKPTGLAVTANSVTAHNATITWFENGEANTWIVEFATDADFTDILTETVEDTSTYTFQGLAPETTYYVRVKTHCGLSDESEYTNVVNFTTAIACPAPTNLTANPGNYVATLNWNGTNDNYIVNYRTAAYAEGIVEEFNTSGVPSGWTRYSGLVDDVIAGDVTLASVNSYWNTTSYALGKYNMKLNIFGATTKHWLVTPEFNLSQNLSFDLALTKYNNEDPIASDTLQADDRFVVLIYANDAWTKLREWNNSGSGYVYNAISATGENVTIDLSAYYGQDVKIAFYGESTSSTGYNAGDNDLHIDNVICGIPYAAGEWQTVTVTDTTATITGLTPLTAYEARVLSDCGELDSLSLWTPVITFTTLEACPAPLNVEVDNITSSSATVSWEGYNDSYIVSYRMAAHTDGIIEHFDVSGVPSGWTRYTGLVDYVLTDSIQLTSATGGWSLNGYALGQYNMRVNIYGSNCKYWLVTPEFRLSQNLSFDLALTDYNNEDPIESDTLQADDRFVVLIYADDAWHILREWNNSGSEHVFNAISTTGENVTINLSAYYGKMVKIAFYGESTASGGDNDLHIDNIKCGVPVEAGEWQAVDATETTVTLNGLTPATPYEVKVKGFCDSNETEWSETTFTTSDQIETFTLNITGYGSDDNAGGWNFIASPMVSGSAPGNVTNLVADPVENYDLYRLNPSTMIWENYKNTTEHPDFTTMVNGRGYLYANKNTVTLSFSGTLKTGELEVMSLSQGWNLVGNPFAEPAYVNKPYYRMNAEGTDIEAVEEYYLSTNKVPAGTGIVVDGSSYTNINFFTKEPVGSTGHNGNLQMTLTKANERGAAVQDKAIVSFNEGSRLSKYVFNDRNAKLYFTQDGQDYAITYSEKQGEMPVNFKARENGAYTLTINPEDVELDYLHLIDNLTGNDVDLLTTPYYTFSAKSDDYASRFKLVFSTISDNENFAFISNGEIIVNGEGIVQVIDLMGRGILTEETNRNVSTAGLVPGVYVLRLIHGEQVKTQKIVVK